MTFELALRQWKTAPRNCILANNSKDAVKNIILKKYKDIDLEQFTEKFCRRIFEECPFDQAWKTQAAAILIYILNWGADNGYCPRPKFDRSIALPQPPKLTGDPVVDTPRKSIVEEFLDNPNISESTKNMIKDFGDRKVGHASDVLKEDHAVAKEPKKEEPQNKEVMENVYNNEPKKVVQIDPETLQPLKTFDSVSKAQKETGGSNIGRAIENRSISGGYYWCYPGDENTFKPKEKKAGGRPPKKIESVLAHKDKKDVEKTKVISKVMPANVHDVNVALKPNLDDYTDDELVDELKRRGYTGQIIKNIVL